MSVTPNMRQYGNSSVLQVSTTITGTALSTLWTPAAGRRITFKGCSLRARVTTVLAGATPGDAIFLCDNAIGSLIFPIGVITSATEAAGKDFNPVYFDMDMGYQLAAGNAVKVGTTATITTGVIAVHGFVWGIESL